MGGEMARTPGRCKPARSCYAAPMTIRLTRREALAGMMLASAAPAAALQRRELEVPFVPTPHTLVQKMLDLARLEAGDYLIDLGCGDGRIAVAAAQRGARALGVDLDPLRVQEAFAAARQAGLAGQVSFRRQDLFATPLHEADVLALYLLPAINLRLRPQLLTELRPGARVVSHAFDMGDWVADAEETHDGRRIFMWVVPEVAGGSWAVTHPDGRQQALELEQRFQMVSGTLSGGGVSQTVTGRLSGALLNLASDNGTMRMSAVVEGPAMHSSDFGARWRATRLE